MNLNADSCIVVVETSGPVRQLMVSILKSKEFAKTQGVSSIKDAISMMEVENVDWIITPLLRDKEINGFQLLTLLTTDDELRHVRLSLCLDDTELDMVPYAFEKGVFSLFNKKMNKDSFTKDLEVLQKKMADMGSDEVKVSASYLAEYLESASLFQSLITLQKSVLDMYPGDASYLASLAMAYEKSGSKDEAKQCLSQYYFLEGKFPDNSEELVKSLDLDKDKIEAKGAGEGAVRALPLPSCVLVIKDEAKRNEVTEVLTQLGVENIMAYDNGEGAWLALENQKEPALFIMEWDAPILPGPILIQKLKHLFPSMPCVVVNDKFDANDRELLKEMGVIAVLKTDAKKRDIIQTLVYAVRQNKTPSEIGTLEQKIRNHLLNGNMQEASALKEKFDKMTGLSEGKKKLVDADFAFHNNEFAKARDLAIEVVKLDFDSVYVLNLLGKCFLKLNDLKPALRCFSKAQEISPKNIERLCEIAVVNQTLAREGDSKAAIEEAKKIDEGSEKVKETEAGIEIMKGDPEEAKKIMSQLHSVQNVISFMNNQAVAMAKSGLAEESIKLYEQTLQSVPENKKALKAVVLFNLGFAYLRQDKLEQCVQMMEQVEALENEKLKKKAKHLLEQIKSAKENGRSFKIASSSEVEKKPEPVLDEEKQAQIQKDAVVHAIAMRPGQYCCLKVFINPEKPSHQLVGLVASVPRFSKRENIQKEVSGGLEKDIKNS